MSNPLDYLLDDAELERVEQQAIEELQEAANEVFFFGEIVSMDDVFFDHDDYVDNAIYSQCPCCGNVFEVPSETASGEYVECPGCNQEGNLFEFRDEEVQLDEFSTRYFALMETYEKGYILRLFDVSLSYANREYDNYSTLVAEPDLVIREAAREYWHEGKLYYYSNCGVSPTSENFQEVSTYDDCNYYIVNYDNPYDPMTSAYIGDDSDGVTPFMERISHSFNYNVFRTLKAYDFHSLCCDMLYAPSAFSHSSKISEILSVDYNQVIANFTRNEFGLSELLAARELKTYGIKLTRPNVNVMKQLGHDADKVLASGSVQKTFKYLRNQLMHDSSSVRDYKDYINECIKLGYDITQDVIRYPSKLKEAHRRTSQLVKIENGESAKEAVKNVYFKYRELCEFKSDGLAVVMPSSCEDIIAEGIALEHCVGGYCERVARGEDFILFVRKVDEIEKSFYTMEIRPNLKKLDIVQCRGYRNKDGTIIDIDEEVVAFLEKYAQWFSSRPAKPSSLKRIYYKAVKKTDDGKYISLWDNKTEYIIGKTITAKMDENPDKVAVPGIHIASLEFAKKFGGGRKDAVIIEVEVDLNDVVIPNAKDQIRASKVKVLREVPANEVSKKTGLKKAG